MSDTPGSQVAQSRDGTITATRYKDPLAACGDPSNRAEGQWRKRLDQIMKARHEEPGCDVSVVKILRVLGVEPAAYCLYVRTRPMGEFNLNPRPVKKRVGVHTARRAGLQVILHANLNTGPCGGAGQRVQESLPVPNSLK